MASEAAAIQELVKKLDEDRTTYFTTLAQFHDRLTLALSAYNQAPIVGAATGSVPPAAAVATPASPRLPPSVASRRNPPSSFLELTSHKKASVFSTEGDESSDSDDNESFFVQDALPQEFHSQDDLKEHLKKHNWKNWSRSILGDLLDRNRLHDNRKLFEAENESAEDAEHHSADLYFVSGDGAALHANANEVHGLKDIWDALQSINTDPSRKQHVGRIAILREPSSLLFAAIHLTMNQHFDMDEIFRMLIDDSPTKAHMKGCLEEDERHRRSFVFCFKYHTIVGEGRQPMPWQESDNDLELRRDHIPISTCSSVVALSLSGSPSQTLSRRSRRKRRQTVCNIYDAFAPWQVVSIQCHPDWNHNEEVHQSSHHYVNGPDAFLHTLLAEYRDAYKRFNSLSRMIARLVTPPKQFIFDRDLREDLLFENENFTYSHRYFWASQTLALLTDEIESMVREYEETFTDEVWSGEDRYIWPGTKDKSARYSNWRKRMAGLKKQFEIEISKLKDVLAVNRKEQIEINTLREQLFSGTSVRESREAVRLADTTVTQGQNIRLLTLVSIAFLPLTFVTSVFGMTNMPNKDSFVHFGIVVITVCVPTYLLIAVVEHRNIVDASEAVYKWILACFGRKQEHAEDYEKEPRNSRKRRASRTIPAIVRTSSVFEREEVVARRPVSRPHLQRESRVLSNGSSVQWDYSSFQRQTPGRTRMEGLDEENANGTVEMVEVQKSLTDPGPGLQLENGVPAAQEPRRSTVSRRTWTDIWGGTSLGGRRRGSVDRNESPRSRTVMQ